MKSVFERITELLDEIEFQKTAAKTDAGAGSKVTTPSFGEHTAWSNKMLSKNPLYYGTPTEHDYSGPGSKKWLDPTGNATFTGDDPQNEKPARTIDATELDINQYKHASTEELLFTTINVGNSILQDLVGGHQDTATQQQSSTKTAGQNTQTGTNQNVDAELTKFAGDILYSVQKQAEHHADLVGKYLYGKLAESLAKTAMDELNELSDETETENLNETEEAVDEEAELPTPQETSDETEVDEKKNNAKSSSDKHSEEDTTGEEDTEQEESSEDETADDEGESSEESDEKSESEPHSSMSEDEAVQALNEMAGAPNDDAVLDQLSQALLEMGVPLDQLAGAGPAGAKLASAVGRFRHNNTLVGYRPPKTELEKKARDFCRNYIKELLTRTRQF